jgi:geranylgeranyl diphosphate synthase type I
MNETTRPQWGHRDMLDDLVSYMATRVDRFTAPSNTVATYHLGWTDSSGKPISNRPGKYTRAVLALLAAEACEIPHPVALSSAVAVEFVHNFSLLHDDIMDRDTERRGRPTAWFAFDETMAILTGDAFLAAAYREIFDEKGTRVEAAQIAQAGKILAATVQDLIHGQALDLDLESRPHPVPVADCRRMHRGKTAVLLACSTALPALLGGIDADRVQNLYNFGLHLGYAFQAMDDILGIWGDPNVTGKSTWGDLRRNKKTMPVCAALESENSASKELLEFMKAENGWREQPQLLAECASLIERAGGRSATEAEMEKNYLSGIASLANIDMDDQVRVRLAGMAEFVVRRQF